MRGLGGRVKGGVGTRGCERVASTRRGCGRPGGGSGVQSNPVHLSHFIATIAFVSFTSSGQVFKEISGMIYKICCALRIVNFNFLTSFFFTSDSSINDRQKEITDIYISDNFGNVELRNSNHAHMGRAGG